jgi:leader peptidase (prepilin peptidase) / N-methyltransferase
MAAFALDDAPRRAFRLSWSDLAVGAMVVAFVVALWGSDAGILRSAYASAGVAVLAGIAWFDLRTHRAPNRITYPATLLALAGSLTLGWESALSSLVGGLAAFGVFLVIALLGRGAMGYGDVKVAALAGVLVGIKGFLPLLLVTHLAGAIFAAAALGLRLRRRGDEAAFTPFLLLGVVACAWIAPTLGPY